MLYCLGQIGDGWLAGCGHAGILGAEQLVKDGLGRTMFSLLLALPTTSRHKLTNRHSFT